MKILVVNKFLYPKGGAETYLLKLGSYLTELGHEVQYFGMEDSKRCLSNRVQAYTKNLDFHNSSRMEQLTYPFRIIYSGEARKKIRLVLDDFMPDVIHLNNFNYQLTPSILLEIERWRHETGKHAGIVYTVHDPQLVCPNHMLYNPNTMQVCEKCISGKYASCIFGRCIHGSAARSVIGAVESWFWNKKKVYRYLDAIVCCSEFIKTKIDTNPMLAKKTIALHNFVEKTEKKKVQKKNYVLYFGRYSIEKGLETLLKVCRELPDVSFVFAGSGPLENLVEGISNVSNVGFRSGEELETLVREALFTIYPSECYENCPFSVLESISYGTPVLGANIGGIPELIDEGKNGELFKSGDAADLKEKVIEMWSNRKKQEEYSENCLNAQFDTIQEYSRKILEIYEESSQKKREKIRIVHTAALDVDGVSAFVMNEARLINHDRFVIDAITYRHREEFFQEKIESLGGQKYEVDIENIRFKPMKMWKKFSGVYHILKNNRIQVLHLDTESSDQLFLAFAAKFAGVKTVLYHSHSSNTGRVGLHRRLIEEISRSLMPLVVDDYLTCSAKAAEAVFPNRIVKNRLYKLINNGICAEKYRYDPEIRSTYRKKFGVEEKMVIIHVGRFIPLKNQGFLVDIFEKIHSERPDSVLVLVGEGETIKEVKNRVTERKLDDCVLFTGIRDDIPELLQMADIFVLPSVYEGVPLAGIEAQAAGLPCLISDSVSRDMQITDLVEYMQLGGPVSAWADKIIEMSGKERRDTLAEIIKSGYDMAEVVKVLSNLYEGKK